MPVFLFVFSGGWPGIRIFCLLTFSGRRQREARTNINDGIRISPIFCLIKHELVYEQAYMSVWLNVPYSSCLINGTGGELCASAIPSY